MTTSPAPPLPDVLADLAALEDPGVLAVNRRHGDAHAVNLTRLRALAKRLGSQPELAAQLWSTGDSAARLLSILVTRPRLLGRETLDAMLREAATPKEHAWLIGYIVAKSPHAPELRRAWAGDPDPLVEAAAWALTTKAVARHPEQLDLSGLLDVIEARMEDAPERLQWAMNECLAQIGIEHPDLRDRAIGIGDRLGVLRDYPTPSGCTSPFAPIWIAEIVRRRESA